MTLHEVILKAMQEDLPDLNNVYRILYGDCDGEYRNRKSLRDFAQSLLDSAADDLHKHIHNYGDADSTEQYDYDLSELYFDILVRRLHTIYARQSIAVVGDFYHLASSITINGEQIL